MKSLLIKDTTREEREQIVADSIGSIEAACDGSRTGRHRDVSGVYRRRKRNCARSIANTSRIIFPVGKVRRAANAGCFNFMRGLFPSFFHVKAQQKGGYPTDSE